jgi:luciferase family oxidoreductase group 1
MSDPSATKARPLRVSVLDTVPHAPGCSPSAAIATVVKVAKAAEALGYHRIWIAEHHGVPEGSCPQPALLISLLAERTRTIRVGSGGMMLPNHTPLTIAEQFALLTSVYGDRIDLGLGRGGRSPDSLLDQAIGRRAGAEEDAAFLSDVVELNGFLTGNWPAEHPYRVLTVPPASPAPPIYLLGASVGSAQLAGRTGCAYVFGRHLAPRVLLAAAASYRAAWSAAGRTGEPQLIVSSGVFCADTQQAADSAALTAGLIKLRVADARLTHRNASVAELTDPVCGPAEKTRVIQMYAASGYLIGDSVRVAAGLRDLADRTGATEIMLVPGDYTEAGRLRTLTAAANGLQRLGVKSTLAS